MGYMDVDRALLLDESCHFGHCLKKGGVVANICDVQLRRFQTCMNLVREWERDKSMSFVWVTRHRPDVYWVGRSVNPRSPRFDRNNVYLHSWAACGYGGADWFFFAGRDKADVIARMPDEFSCEMYRQVGILPQPCFYCLGCECTMVAW